MDCMSPGGTGSRKERMKRSRRRKVAGEIREILVEVIR